MTTARAILCPYCGDRHAPDPAHPECRACGGRFDAWSIAATQNDMGAWYVRDARRPHFVGFRHAALVAAIRAGEIGRDAIVRGPTTRQLWTIARRAQGIAHLFGRCHACQAPVTEAEPACAACGATPDAPAERNYFGLPPFEPIAPPTGARADFAAFLEDSGLLVVRARAVPPPGAAIVRVAPPVAAPVESQVGAKPSTPAVGTRLATVGAAAPAPVPAVATAPAPASTPVAEPPPNRALSPIDRSLVARTRSLERVNRMLFAAAVVGFALALLFGFLFAEQSDRHAKAVVAARRQGADEVRAEFEKKAPVEVRPPAELPPMPEAPAAPRR
ncbi:MAG: hypothetical protein RI967_312 [Planctomycetota bacterium]